jgi:hypothetical protein
MILCTLTQPSPLKGEELIYPSLVFFPDIEKTLEGRGLRGGWLKFSVY